MTQVILLLGVLNGRYKVYIDPYSSAQARNNTMLSVTKVLHLMTLVCSIVHMYLYKWLNIASQDTFQPKIGFKTRYGLITNPFAETGAISGAATVNDVLLTLTDTTKSTSCKLNVILLCEVQTSEKGAIYSPFFCSK